MTEQLKDYELIDDKTFSFVAPFPKILSGKKKGSLAVVNTIPSWLRYQKTKIKNAHKDFLKKWIIPEPRGEKINPDLVHIVYQIQRPTKQNIDSDAGSVSAYKWTTDALVDLGYMNDDNIVLASYLPTKLGVKDLQETIYKTTVYFYKKKDSK